MRSIRAGGLREMLPMGSAYLKSGKIDASERGALTARLHREVAESMGRKDLCAGVDAEERGQAAP